MFATAVFFSPYLFCAGRMGGAERKSKVAETCQSIETLSRWLLTFDARPAVHIITRIGVDISTQP